MQFRALLFAVTIVGIALSGCVEPTKSGDSGDDAPGEEGSVPQNRTVTWGSLDSATIRPGAQLGDYCTFNFLYTSPNGSAYIGTAAHCTTEIGERVGSGANGEAFGTVVYDSDITPGADAGVDFSLILIDADQVGNAHPTMFGYEGPTGTIEAGEAAQGDQVALYGYGLVLGNDERTRPRFGVLMDEDGESYRANMPAVNGDSGSPLIHVPTGKAFGIISHYGIDATPPTTDEGPIMPYILSQLSKAGLDVSVATA